MPIPLEQTMCWDKSSQKNSANTPVLMMAAIPGQTGGKRHNKPHRYSGSLCPGRSA